MVKIIYGDRIGKQGKISVSCTAIIFDQDHRKILLTRRSDNGRWCLPGGQMDAGESITEACLREIWEETGIKARIKRLAGVFSSPDMLLTYADGNCYQTVNFLFEAEVQEGELTLSDETTEIDYFTLAEIEQMDVMEHHVQRLQVVLNSNDSLIVQ